MSKYALYITLIILTGAVFIIGNNLINDANYHKTTCFIGNCTRTNVTYCWFNVNAMYTCYVCNKFSANITVLIANNKTLITEYESFDEQMYAQQHKHVYCSIDDKFVLRTLHFEYADNYIVSCILLLLHHHYLFCLLSGIFTMVLIIYFIKINTNYDFNVANMDTYNEKDALQNSLIVYYA